MRRTMRTVLFPFTMALSPPECYSNLIQSDGRFNAFTFAVRETEIGLAEECLPHIFGERDPKQSQVRRAIGDDAKQILMYIN